MVPTGMLRAPLPIGTLALLLGLGAGVAEAAPAQPSAAQKKAQKAAKKKASGAPAARPAETPVDPYGDAAPADKPEDPVDPYGDAPAAAGAQAGANAAPSAPPASAGPSLSPGVTSSSAPPAAAPSAAPAAAPSAPAPSAPPAGPSGDLAEAQLAEEVAFAVAARAQELLDAKQYADAKQLALEAIARSPRGVAAERAGLIVRAANAGLGIPAAEEPPAAEGAPAEEGGAAPPLSEQRPLEDSPTSRRVAMVHAGLYGGLLGATVGGIAHDSAGVEVAVGAVGAAAGAYFLPRYLQRYSTEQVRTIGSASMWGGAVGGLLADVTTSLDDTTPRQVLLGAALGATAATAGGLYLAKQRTFTRGDVALVDTLASIGAVGGLTLGLAMQPVQGEGYSLNAALGAAAGVVTGFVAAPQTDTTERRMLRVAGAAAAGGAAPWLLYAVFSDSGTNNDEQVFGLLSTAGLLAGAYFGLRWTRGMDEGKDVHDATANLDDAPPALLRRSSGGALAFGGLGLRTSLQAPERAYVLDVLAGRF